MPNIVSPHAARQVLHETRELCRKQDKELQRYRRVVAASFVIYFTVVSIAVSASGDLRPLAGASLLFGGGFVLVLTALLVEIAAYGWRPGPYSHELELIAESCDPPQRTDVLLARCHRAVHTDNQAQLLKVIGATAFHILVAVSLVSLMIKGLLGAVPDSIEPTDPPAIVEHQDPARSEADPVN